MKVNSSRRTVTAFQREGIKAGGLSKTRNICFIGKNSITVSFLIWTGKNTRNNIKGRSFHIGIIKFFVIPWFKTVE